MEKNIVKGFVVELVCDGRTNYYMGRDDCFTFASQAVVFMDKARADRKGDAALSKQRWEDHVRTLPALVVDGRVYLLHPVPGSLVHEEQVYVPLS